MPASPEGPTPSAPRPLELPYTMIGTLTVPAGSQVVMDVTGMIREVRLPDGTLLALFPQAYVRPSRDDNGQALSGDALGRLGCQLTDQDSNMDALTSLAPIIMLDELSDLPPGPAQPASAQAGTPVTAHATLHLPDGTTQEGGLYRLPTGEYVAPELCLVQHVERGGIPLNDEQTEDLGCRLDRFPELPLFPPF